MKKHLYLSLLLISILSFTSCQQRMYFPDRVNTPGIREGKEVMVNASFKPQFNNTDSAVKKPSPLSPSFDIAFSPIDHLGIIGSYRAIVNRNIGEENWLVNNGDVFGGTFNGHRFDIGAGYFDRFSKYGLFEVYAGYGNGFIKREGLQYPFNDYSSRYHRFFFQPGVGISVKAITFTTGFRLSFQKFYDFRSPDPQLANTIAEDQNHSGPVTGQLMGFFEPFVNFEAGSPFLRFNIQAGAGAQVLGGNVSGVFPGYLSMGITFRYAQRFFQK